MPSVPAILWWHRREADATVDEQGSPGQQDVPRSGTQPSEGRALKTLAPAMAVSQAYVGQAPPGMERTSREGTRRGSRGPLASLHLPLPSNTGTAEERETTS